VTVPILKTCFALNAGMFGLKAKFCNLGLDAHSLGLGLGMGGVDKEKK